VKVWKKIYQANGPRAGVAMLISGKVDFKLTLVKRQRRSLHTIKRSNISRRKTIIILYAHNVSASYFIKHTLKDLKSNIDTNTAVVGDFIPTYH
jgi:uncharacterized protein YcbX